MSKVDLTKSKTKPHVMTSIGKSANSKPTNKHKRRAWKAYRGQGK